MNIDISRFSEPCECGRKHSIFVKGIIIEAGAIKKLPVFLDSIYNGKREEIGMICDDNTYTACGSQIERILNGCQTIQLPSKGLHADNHGVKLAQEKLKQYPDVKLILAVGSGTIHDISRYIANELKIPFVSVPTAASVDGFVSTVAAMTWNGFKKTLPAVAPILVAADSDIFSKAPYRLTASGISDLLGKYTALADWEISHLVTGEYICYKVCELEHKALEEVIGCIQDLRNDSEEEKRIKAYEQLMYALLLSGIAMQMIGNSRPASGAEHHISHLWEMEVINGTLDAYHGEKVSIGLILAVKAYHQYKDAIQKGAYSLKPYRGLELELINETFGAKGLYEGMLEENTPDPLASIHPDHFKKLLPSIAVILGRLPENDELYQLLTDAGCIKEVKEIGLNDSIIPKTLSLSPYVRNRLTFMRLTKLLQLEVV